MKKELLKLDEHIHAMKDAGFTNIYVGNLTRQSGGVMGPHDKRGYQVTIYFEKEEVKDGN